MKAYRFAQNKGNEFERILNDRVRDYFKENQIETHANLRMILKTILFFGSFLSLYLLILFGGIQNLVLLFSFWALLGIGQSIVGIVIMHDAVHGSYSKKKWVNLLLEIPIVAIGVESSIWKIEHNFIHHNFTNIEGVDQDINPRYLFRFSANQKRRWFHRFQHIYAVFFYGLMTLEWVTIKDFLKVKKYYKEGFITSKNAAFMKMIVVLCKKLVFFFLYLVAPLLLLDFDWYIVVSMFLTMVVISGVVMTITFQTAHVVPNCSFLKQEENEIAMTWHRHQLQTTANFGTNSRLTTYLLGGLNFQIEHHLFPSICHVYYPGIAQIVRSTAEEFSLPYHENTSYFSAIWGHFTLLRKMGKEQII